MYLHLHDAGQVRFGMDNALDAPKGAVSPGVLTMKFQDLKSNSYTSVLNLKCEWEGRGLIKTLRHFLLMLYLIDGS